MQFKLLYWSTVPLADKTIRKTLSTDWLAAVWEL